jgi:polysaccharide biosynthesis transport protein
MTESIENTVPTVSGLAYQRGDGLAVDQSLDLRLLIDIFKRRLLLIAIVTTLCFLLGVLYLGIQSPSYTATTVMQLNVRPNSALNLETAIISNESDNAAIQSEIDIIKSRTVVRRVISTMKLLDHPEFNKKSGLSFLSTIFGAAHTEVVDPQTHLINVTDALLENLDVTKDPRSYTVRIAYKAHQPALAQEIANMIAAEYLAYQVDSEQKQVSKAIEELNPRIEELRNKLKESEQAAENFSRTHNLYALDGLTLGDQRVSELNKQLVEARADLEQKRARLSSARRLLQRSAEELSTVTEVLNSPLIQSLREQESQMMTRRSELSSLYTADHPKIKNLESEIGALRLKINREVEKIVQSFENEAMIAAANAASLERKLNDAHSQVASTEEYRVQLSELQREAEADRILYESFLNNYKKAKETQNIEKVSAKIISLADLPLKPSHPKKPVVLLATFLGGLLLGAALAIILDVTQKGFTSIGQIERLTGVLALGMVPRLPFKNREKSAQTILNSPNSKYAESLKSVMTLIQLNRASDTQNASFDTLLTIPCSYGNHNSVFSVSLARNRAAQGKKVIYIDLDIYNAPAAAILPAHDDESRDIFMYTDLPLEQTIQQDTLTDMHYIVPTPKTRYHSNILESDTIRQIVKRASEHYDLVVVNAPALSDHADGLQLAKLVDVSILTAAWAQTPKSVVQDAVRLFKAARVKLSGIVLTEVKE